MTESRHHQIVVVGGGTAGITVAARLKRGWFNSRDVAIIEPAETHYYQPLWTLVGAGVCDKKVTARSMASVIPRGVSWIKDGVESFLPEENAIVTRSGQRVTYDWLIVAAGIQINWNKIPGLVEAMGHDGVCSNYSFETVDSTWQTLKDFQGGTAIFTQPSGAVKCGGAPQKIMYLVDDYLRRHHKRDASTIIFAAPGKQIFGIEKYRKTLEQVVARKQIDCHFQHELVEVHGPQKEAVFKNLQTGELETLSYYMLHVTPPMSAPAFIASSPLADEQGWVDVDKLTLRHHRFPNVFSLGDCSSLPTSKTGAAIRKQAPVLVTNLVAAMKNAPLTAHYQGYTSCPVVTGYGKLVLAEFNYEHQPDETFPFDQSKERWSMYLLKRYLLPLIYWHGMLKGRM
ncbi:MAG: FAD/NAD(P)-binding oxidoreductase [Planctomycetota bacterium]|nr:FAD/NAD(P)-binding oxidoreductase [Planctomycetota bacterium]MDA1212690.1 FAD/NAD(P)-binding oxidoreductase [Planctomycetota bacterium]